jgi:hypothetical protein
MITGYNTDVRHGEVVFHVQTEDKGRGNPFIESLVYVGGQVLASKRASYAELIAGGKEEKEIVAFMDHQHRTMIAAIRHGKLDGKLASLAAGRQTGGYPVAGATGAIANVGPGAPTPRAGVPAVPAAPPRPTMSPMSPLPPVPPVPPTTAVPVSLPLPPGRLAASETVSRAAAVAGETVSGPVAAVSLTPDTPLEPYIVRPPRPPAPERTLDQVILEYLTSEADQEQLVLLIEEERELTLGRRATLVLRASSSKSGQPIPGAQISVRMISTVAEPRVLAAGRTEETGVLSLGFDIPELGRGTSALIINAVSNIGRAELKHLL